MGRCKSLGSLRSFLGHAPQLSWASIPWFFLHPDLPWGSPWGVAAAGGLLDGRYSSPSWVPLELPSSPWTTEIADDCDILVYWYGRKYFISQVYSCLFQKHFLCSRPLTKHWDSERNNISIKYFLVNTIECLLWNISRVHFFFLCYPEQYAKTVCKFEKRGKGLLTAMRWNSVMTNSTSFLSRLEKIFKISNLMYYSLGN